MAYEHPFCEWWHETRDPPPVADEFAYRAYLAVETNLAREDQNINARTSWLLNSQGFLLAAYFLASSKNTDLPRSLDAIIGILIAAAGLVVSYFARRSIKAADEQIEEIKKVHLSLPTVDRHGLRSWPYLRPYGSQKGHGDGRAFSRSLPLLVTALWVCILAPEVVETWFRLF